MIVVQVTPKFVMNLAAVWFGIVERRHTPGTSGSVKDLDTKIRVFIDGRDERSHPSSRPRLREGQPEEASRV